MKPLQLMSRSLRRFWRDPAERRPRGPRRPMMFGMEPLERRDCPAVMFAGFDETSPNDPVPLLNTNLNIIGSNLLLNPNGFQSQASPSNGNDSTVSFFVYSITADPNTGIASIRFSLAGDTTIIGAPSSFASSGVSANVLIEVTEVDGNQAVSYITSVNFTFTDNNGQFSLGQNGILAGETFEGEVTVDINALLASNNDTGTATEVRVTMSTVLDTDASSQGSSFIQIKTGEVNVNTVEIQPLGSIGDTIFLDTNGDGVQNNGETGIDGVTVTLFTAGTDNMFGTPDDVVVLTDVTSNGGKYLFENLTLGEYKVVVTTGSGPLVGLDNTGDPDNVFDSMSIVTINAQTPNNLDQDFGYRSPPILGTIGDTVFIDTNGDGMQNNGEVGVDGVTVTLQFAGTDGIFGTGDDSTMMQDTANGGMYLFTELTLGLYRVTVNTNSSPIAGLFNTADPDGVFDSTSVLTLTENVPVNLLQDFGYQDRPGTIGDFIFLDLNGDGMFNGLDVGAPGVQVFLFRAGNDGVFGTGDDVQVASDFTDVNGNYLFEDLVLGTYQVRVNTATGGLATLVNTVDPDGGFNSISTVTINTQTPVNLLQDFGYAPAQVLSQGLIAGVVYVDGNDNGIVEPNEPGIGGVTIRLFRYNQNGTNTLLQTTTTDQFGFYSFQGLEAGAYRVIETQPGDYYDGKDTIGTLGSINDENDQFNGIFLPTNGIGVGYNFGEMGLKATSINKSNFLATSSILAGNPVATGLQNRFGANIASNANAPLINAFLNPAQAQLFGFDASMFAGAFGLPTQTTSTTQNTSQNNNNDEEEGTGEA